MGRELGLGLGQGMELGLAWLGLVRLGLSGVSEPGRDSQSAELDPLLPFPVVRAG